MATPTRSAEDGLNALQQGRTLEAFEILVQAVANGDNRPNSLRGLAYAARAAGKPEQCLQAAEKLLSTDPANIEAMILKADALKASGDPRKATAFYLAAVQGSANQNPGHLAAEIERAKRECADAAIHYEEFLREKVRALGIFDGSGHARGEQTLDVLFGRKQIYYQQPEKFYFPELPQVQFYDPALFPWAKDLIAQTDSIRAELETVLSNEDGFEPYVPSTSSGGAPHVRDNALMGNADWGAFHLMKDGVTIEKNARRCPATMKALESVPRPNVRGKSPIALFSRLKPGAHIPPHTGLMNTRIICHLPLIVPAGCSIRVGNQERSWKMGEMLIFDDSIEHEARNASASERVILLFDIWRPELSEDERSFVSTVFDAIEDYGVFA